MNETIGDMANRAHQAVDETVDRVAPTVNRMKDKAHEAIDRVHERVASVVLKHATSLSLLSR